MHAQACQRAYITGILLVAGFLPLYIIRFSVLGIPTNIFEIGVLIVLLMGVCSEEIRRSWRATMQQFSAPYRIAIAVFLLSAVIATAISYEVRVSLGILKGWVIIPAIFGFLAVSAARKTSGMQNRILDSLICSATIVSVFGIIQIGTLARVQSIYDVPNSLALFVVPIFIIALYTGVQLKSRIYLVFAGVIGVAILATQSAGAMFAIAGTIVIAVFLIPRLTSPNPSFVRRGIRRSLPLTKGELEGVAHNAATPPHLPSYEGRKLRVPFLFFMILALIIFFSSGRFQYLISPLIHPNTANSVTVRFQFWDIGVRLIKQHPIFGIGLGQFEPAYQAELHHLFEQYNNPPHFAQGLRGAPQPEYVFRDPHNWIISFWLNVGILGLISFGYLNYFAIKYAFSSRSQANTYNLQLTTGLVLALIAMLLYGLVDTIYWKNDLSALWWLLVLWPRVSLLRSK